MSRPLASGVSVFIELICIAGLFPAATGRLAGAESQHRLPSELVVNPLIYSLELRPARLRD